MKVSVIFGTRPEAIKLAPVILALRRDPRFSTHVCVTAQHREMLDQVLEIFGIVPDADLDLMRPNQTLTHLTCNALPAIGEYLKRERPDLVLVQGDTTTVFATALAAFYHDVPVGHVEAGLRTRNMKSPWPEEANRVLTTRLAALHFAPTQTARINLLSEGIEEERIFVTGNTVIDALYLALRQVRRNPPQIPGLDSSILNGDPSVPLVLVTAHRRESFGDKLESICRAVACLASTFPRVQFVYPVHRNPKVRHTVEDVLGAEGSSSLPNIHLIEPLSYLAFVALMERATLLLTDSGGVQEEAPTLGKPVLVMRDTTERPEALDGGTVKLVGADPSLIFTETARLLEDVSYFQSMAQVRHNYGDGTASLQIIEAVSNHFRASCEPVSLAPQFS